MKQMYLISVTLLSVGHFYAQRPGNVYVRKTVETGQKTVLTETNSTSSSILLNSLQKSRSTCYKGNFNKTITSNNYTPYRINFPIARNTFPGRDEPAAVQVVKEENGFLCS